jgi:hypothetical protein
MNSKTNSIEKTKYQVYIDERKSLFNASLEQSHLFDKAILTLASGALGLSLTFIHQIIPEGCEPRNIYSLILAWIFLTLSILSTVISFLTSYKACIRQIEIMEIKYFSGEENKKNEKLKNKKNNSNCYRRITKWLNIFSILCFVGGIFFLAKFSVQNLQNIKEINMAKEKKITEGFVPPQPPKIPDDKQTGFVPPNPPKEPPKPQKPSK